MPFKCKSPCNKGEAGSAPVQEHKWSRMLQLKGWIPETENAAIEGNSQKAGENGRGKSCWDPWKRAGNFCLYQKMTQRRAWQRESCCSGEVAITSSRSWLLLAVPRRNTACCSTCQHSMWCQYFVYSMHWVLLSFPVWIFLSNNFVLRLSKLQKCNFWVCKNGVWNLGPCLCTKRMGLISHLLKAL